MRTQIFEMLETYKRLYKDMDDNGGPAKTGDLFETIMGLEEDILACVDLPPAQKFRQILWGNDLDRVVAELEKAGVEYGKREIRDPALILVNAIVNRIDEPENILPMAGLSLDTYQIFVFRHKLLEAHTAAGTDAIIEEMRIAEGRLDGINRLLGHGIKKNLELYHELVGAGLRNLDEFLMEHDRFDLDDDEMDARQFCIRGFFRAGREMFRESADDFGRAILLRPGEASLYYNRAIVFEQMRDRKSALEDYTAAIELDPDDPQPYCNRGVIYAQGGDHELALKDLDRAIELAPSVFQSYCNRGNLLALMDRHEDAVDDYTMAIALRPDEAYLYCNRGISYFQLGRVDKALVDLEKSAGMGFGLAEEFMKEYVAGDKGLG